MAVNRRAGGCCGFKWGFEDGARLSVQLREVLYTLLQPSLSNPACGGSGLTRLGCGRFGFSDQVLLLNGQ